MMQHSSTTSTGMERRRAHRSSAGVDVTQSESFIRDRVVDNSHAGSRPSERSGELQSDVPRWQNQFLPRLDHDTEVERAELGCIGGRKASHTCGDVDGSSTDCCSSASPASNHDDELLIASDDDELEAACLLDSSSPPSGKTRATDDSIVKFFKSNIVSEMDVQAYMTGRQMTPLQERMNAITVVPNVIYCFYFLLSGAWLVQSLIDEEFVKHSHLHDVSGCVHSSWFPNLHALPPLPAVAAAFGISIHAPFSFIYHWKYAHEITNVVEKAKHWSRRMDQVMIHAISASMAYATSGRLDFFLVNLLFNVECMYRQMQTRIRPHANKVRIFISILAYTTPILRRGDLVLFCKLWAVFFTCGWLFAKYPIGGWSHSVFHLVVALIPPLLMTAALDLPASQEQLQLAARCYVSKSLAA